MPHRRSVCLQAAGAKGFQRHDLLLQNLLTAVNKLDAVFIREQRSLQSVKKKSSKFDIHNGELSGKPVEAVLSLPAAHSCHCVCGRKGSQGAAPIWSSDSEESGGGVGGFDGGRMLLLSAVLNLSDTCLLMLLLGFRGFLLLSSLAAGWTRSLMVSEDSSMYARFSPKKSSSWQLAEEAMWRGKEGRTTGWQEGEEEEEMKDGSEG